jgi:serine/threonine-protein kinase
MNDIPPSDNGSLPLDVEEQVDKICDRFEEAWKQGQRPRIEDYLGDLVEPGRTALLHHLIKLDIYYRRRAGEDTTAEDYCQRFPDLGSLLAVSTLFEIPTPGSVSIGAAPTGRYEMGDEIDHGGMGAVFKGRDRELDRDLAIKVLLEEHQDNPDVVQRFLEEPRIGGRLQHPGVVPVYDLGQLSDGRPFFIMKLVEGRTLAKLLAERTDPVHELPRFLKIFEQICQTLAYAHSKGVIHRDLKPRNIMIGAFGEVQVMDWGFAKVLRKEQASALAAGSGESTARDEGTVSLSWTGQVMGTPAYMPPEQARGEVNQLDERCDVFALGAMLCVLLTGQPPYRGGREEVLEAAREGNQADVLARLDRCGADADLVRLAKACLQPRAEDRPRDAGAVAEQVTAYLVGVQERLRQAEMERAAAQAREEEARARAEAEAQALRAERRARQRTLALAVAVLGLVLLGGGGWMWVERDRQARRDETNQGVNLALGKVEQLRQQAEQTPPQTLAAAEQVLALWQQALAALEQAEAVLAAGEADATTRERVAALRAAVETGSQCVAAALVQARREVRLLAELDEARLARSQATPQGPYLNNAASAAAYARAFTEFGLEVLRLPEAEAAKRVRGLRPELRTAVVLALDDWAYCVGDRKVRERLRQVARDADDDAWRRDFRKAKDRPQLESLAVEALSRELPASSLYLLAVGLYAEGAAERAEVVLRRAVQLYPADFSAHIVLGWLLEAKGKQVPAAVFEERVGHLRAAVAARPQSALAHYNLGAALKAKGDVSGAIISYKKALDLDPKYAPAHTNLGGALGEQKDMGEALSHLKKALDLDPQYAPAHNNLGVVLQAQGDLKGASVCYTKALTLEPNYALAHYNLGDVLFHQGEVKRAIACLKKALELDPKHALTHYDLGLALQAQGDVSGAIACYRKALELDPKLVPAHGNLGVALHDKGDLQRAIACYHKALKLDPKDAKIHTNLGLLLAAQGDLKGAIACFHQALDLDPKFAPAHGALNSCTHKGKR